MACVKKLFDLSLNIMEEIFVIRCGMKISANDTKINTTDRCMFYS